MTDTLQIPITVATPPHAVGKTCKGCGQPADDPKAHPRFICCCPTCGDPMTDVQLENGKHEVWCRDCNERTQHSTLPGLQALWNARAAYVKETK
jgi:hypothetical protein